MARPALRRTPALLASFCIGVLLTGCGASEPASPFPERPQDIDIARLDPCALLPRDLQAALEVGAGRPSRNVLDHGAQARNCGWDNFETGTSYSVQLVDLDARSAIGDGRPIANVAGYGAVRQVENVDSAPMCGLIIDMGDAQMARVLVLSTRYVNGRPRPLHEVCNETSAVATKVVDESRRLTG